MWEYARIINSSYFQATLTANKFELKFVLLYWGLIGFDFGFINLSNAFLDRLRVPKYHFRSPNKNSLLPTIFFIESNNVKLSLKTRKLDSKGMGVMSIDCIGS